MSILRISMDDEDIFGEDYFPVDPDEEFEPANLEEVGMDLDGPVESGSKGEDISKPNTVESAVPEQTPAEPVEVDEIEPAPPPISTLAEDVPPLLNPPGDSSLFFPVTSDSHRVYLRYRESRMYDAADVEGRCFLERPLSELYQLSIDLAAKRNEELSQWMAIKADSTGNEHQFFVDKYKPKAFVDLLSDDAINRQTLCWLSEWKRNIMSTFAGTTISAPPPMEGDHAPQANKKVLLIGGPPGVGKSALIDVCCKHFKFQAVESGSADDRTRAAMQKLITDVCESRSVLDATRPQLLVIEEIDGDECPAADILVDILKRHPERIKRPVICVCNDVYKKTLRSLREQCTVIQMAAPKPLRLSEKVKSICQKENIKIESLAIDRLVAVCERDVRSILNQLQTLVYRIGRKQDEPIRVADILKYTGGSEGRSMEGAVKDNQRTELELMQLLFEPKRSRPKDYQERVNVTIANAKALPISDLLAHSFVTIPYTDINMRHACSLGGLMSLTDVGVMGRSFTLPMRYASYWCPSVGRPRIDIAGARRLFASRNAKRIDKELVNAALTKSALHSVRASRCMMLSRASWTLYFSRLLLIILSPEHNPVWTKKTTKHVHPEIERICRIYADFGIELAEENAGSGELQVSASGRRPVYVMNPNLRALSELDDQASHVDAFPIGSPMGDLLHAQVKIWVARSQALDDDSVQLIAKGKRSIAPAVDLDDGLDGNKKQRTGGPMSLASWRIQPTGSDANRANGGIVVKKHPFEFRFNEGHTNAVRRVLRLRDFMPQRVRD